MSDELALDMSSVNKSLSTCTVTLLDACLSGILASAQWRSGPSCLRLAECLGRSVTEPRTGAIPCLPVLQVEGEEISFSRRGHEQAGRCSTGSSHASSPAQLTHSKTPLSSISSSAKYVKRKEHKLRCTVCDKGTVRKLGLSASRDGDVLQGGCRQMHMVLEFRADVR
eukprot:753263-Hanusia_phi.AAC.5